MENKIALLFGVMAILSQIVRGEQTAGGYIYQQSNLPQISDFSQPRPHQQPNQLAFSQDLHPPPFQQQNLPNIHQNPVNFASHYHHQQQQQQPFNHQPALNFEPPTIPQLNNVNYSPPQLNFNPQAENNVMRLQFQVLNENQLGNSIEPGCNPEPIVGQFKPELVDLANGGPLTRMITTCGPGTDCKSIVLQSDLNRVQAVLPKPTYNQNIFAPHHRGAQGAYGREIEGRGSVAGNTFTAVESNSLVRPKNRRLIEYSEILQDDFYN